MGPAKIAVVGFISSEATPPDVTGDTANLISRRLGVNMGDSSFQGGIRIGVGEGIPGQILSGL